MKELDNKFTVKVLGNSLCLAGESVHHGHMVNLVLLASITGAKWKVEEARTV
jgi:hypothetical protein